VNVGLVQQHSPPKHDKKSTKPAPLRERPVVLDHGPVTRNNAAGGNAPISRTNSSRPSNQGGYSSNSSHRQLH